MRTHIVQALESIDVRHPSRPGDRRAAVLLPLLLDDDEPALVGIARTTGGVHGGQFALPGGRLESGDATFWDGAFREAREEIGLRFAERLGEMGEFNTWASRHRVMVEVAAIRRPPAWTPQAGEAEAVLEIPLRMLADLARNHPDADDVWTLPIDQGFEFDPTPYSVVGTVPPRGSGHRIVRDGVEYEMPYIWGLTARILHVFFRRVWPT